MNKTIKEAYEIMDKAYLGELPDLETVIKIIDIELL